MDKSLILKLEGVPLCRLAVEGSVPPPVIQLLAYVISVQRWRRMGALIHTCTGGLEPRGGISARRLVGLKAGRTPVAPGSAPKCTASWRHKAIVELGSLSCGEVLQTATMQRCFESWNSSIPSAGEDIHHRWMQVQSAKQKTTKLLPLQAGPPGCMPIKCGQ